MQMLIPPGSVDESMVIKELSLDSTVRHSKGILPMATTAREQGFEQSCCVYPCPEGFIAANMTIEYKRAMDLRKILAFIFVGRSMKRKIIIISNNDAHL
jgi:predicted ATPase with chaperone activity